MYYTKRHYTQAQQKTLKHLFKRAKDIIKMDEDDFSRTTGYQPSQLRQDIFAVDGTSYSDLRNYLTWHHPNLAPNHQNQDWAFANYRMIMSDLPGYYEGQDMLMDYRNWLSQVDQLAIYYQDSNQAEEARYLAQELERIGLGAEITGPVNGQSVIKHLESSDSDQFIIVLD